MRIEVSGPWVFRNLELVPDEEDHFEIAENLPECFKEGAEIRIWDVAGNKFLTSDDNQVCALKQADGEIVLWGLGVSTNEKYKQYVRNL